jgi:diaminohydroxyphosphoribosylaminopyrimidine deaminase/5-amino-6-(5-phosphoribosylamino)uracil reductase
VRTAREEPVYLICSRAAARASTDALEVAGVDVIVATGENESARVRSALTELGARGIQSMLLEGGPHVAGAFLDAGEIDEVRLFIAPMLVGGRHSRVPLEGQGVEAIDAARRALASEVERVHDDVLIRARMTEW